MKKMILSILFLVTSAVAIDDNTFDMFNDDKEHIIVVSLEYQIPLVDTISKATLVDTVISLNRCGNFIKFIHRKTPTITIMEQNIAEFKL